MYRSNKIVHALFVCSFMLLTDNAFGSCQSSGSTKPVAKICLRGKCELVYIVKGCGEVGESKTYYSNGLMVYWTEKTGSVFNYKGKIIDKKDRSTLTCKILDWEHDACFSVN